MAQEQNTFMWYRWLFKISTFSIQKEFFLKQMEKTSCASVIFMNILLSSLTEFTVRQNTPSNDQNFKIRLLLLQQNICLLSYKRVNPQITQTRENKLLHPSIHQHGKACVPFQKTPILYLCYFDELTRGIPLQNTIQL